VVPRLDLPEAAIIFSVRDRQCVKEGLHRGFAEAPATLMAGRASLYSRSLAVPVRQHAQQLELDLVFLSPTGEYAIIFEASGSAVAETEPKGGHVLLASHDALIDSRDSQIDRREAEGRPCSMALWRVAFAQAFSAAARSI
jgi:hypothetical protein